jgi:hypothetical protein
MDPEVSDTVRLRRARAGVVRHLRRFFQRAFILHLRGDPGRPETIAS